MEHSIKGILFSDGSPQILKTHFMNLYQKSGFDSVLEPMSILHDLSISRKMHTLSNTLFSSDSLSYNIRRTVKVYEYLQSDYGKDITLNEISELVEMIEVLFGRFIKERTGKTFIDSLNEIRIDHASHLLISNTHIIAEISFQTNFNNLSCLNRIFKARNHAKSKKFKENYPLTKTFI